MLGIQTPSKKRVSESPKMSQQTPTSNEIAKEEKTRMEKALQFKKRITTQLTITRNTKTDIKNEIQACAQGLYELLKEAEEKIKALTNGHSTINSQKNNKETRKTEDTNLDQKSNIIKLLEENAKTLEEIKQKQITQEQNHQKTQNKEQEYISETNKIELREILKENNKIIRENNAKIDNLNENYKSYLNAVEKYTGRPTIPRKTLYSLIVSSKIETDTGHDLINKITDEVKTKGKEIKIDKVRKAKDRKVILSCSTKEERQKLKEKIEEAKDKFSIEEIKNKNPLVMLRFLTSTINDESIIKEIEERNKDIFKEINKEETKIEIAYKKKTTNNMKIHVILRVSPILWKRMTEKGFIHINVQRVAVWDQSPLIQCSHCLGYGHGKKFCKEKEEGEKCSHCGGQHLRKDCRELKEGGTPTCINCVKAKNKDTEHSAFSQECIIRKKWEELARASIAYC